MSTLSAHLEENGRMIRVARAVVAFSTVLAKEKCATVYETSRIKSELIGTNGAICGGW